MTTTCHVRRLDGFDDPMLTPGDWDRLLGAGETDVVFLTREWMQAWWETLGDGELLLLAAIAQGRIVALAPWYSYGGTVPAGYLASITSPPVGGSSAVTSFSYDSAGRARTVINPDGSVAVELGSQDLGTGTKTIIVQVAAETLGLPMSAIKLNMGDSSLPPSGGSGTATVARSARPARAPRRRQNTPRSLSCTSDKPASPARSPRRSA